MARFAILLALVAGANALSLTPDTYDDAVAGKTVFIKASLPPCQNEPHKRTCAHIFASALN